MNFVLQQDLIEWLKENENENKNSNNGTGLLLAPVNFAQTEEPEIISEPLPDETEIPELIIEETQETEKVSQPEIETPREEVNQQETELQELSEESYELPQEILQPEEVETSVEVSEPEEFTDKIEINKDTWQETATKYGLSLDEPPIELWTQINAGSDYDDVNYQETESLQGSAYIPRHEHGRNFTQRLQEILRVRKQRAEILREEEKAAEKKNNSSLFNAIIMCSAMLIEVALACIALFFLNRYSAMKNIEIKNNPIENEHEEQEQEQKQDKNEQIEIILPNLDDTVKMKEGDVTSKEPEPIIIKLPETYESLLREGTRAYNLKDYDNAIINFHRAMEMRDYDIRSYIGLADAYKAKGMYFDSKRIIDEARKKIGRNPTLEIQLKLLERE